MNIHVGDEIELTEEVVPENTAEKWGSGSLPVYATPAMIKGQEMDDHYFGAIRERIAAFMTDVNEELWKMGVSAKTQHNEVAPGQHELAPIYAQCNVAVDHNQLIMETLKKVAYRHNLQCLLHEKPFEGAIRRTS